MGHTHIQSLCRTKQSVFPDRHKNTSVLNNVFTFRISRMRGVSTATRDSFLSSDYGGFPAVQADSNSHAIVSQRRCCIKLLSQRD